MCIGVPMQVIEVRQFSAICSDGSRREEVDTRLLGEIAAGDWLLVFLGAARDVLEATTALQMRDAIDAVSSIMQGNLSVEHLFADLIEREPPLPPHLQAAVKNPTGNHPS